MAVVIASQHGHIARVIQPKRPESSNSLKQRHIRTYGTAHKKSLQLFGISAYASSECMRSLNDLLQRVEQVCLRLAEGTDGEGAYTQRRCR